MSQSTTKTSSKPKTGASVIAGIVFIALGIAIKGQPWVHPAMFKALDLDLSLVVLNIGVFVIWLGGLHLLFYAPLEEAMDHRTGALEATFEEAEHLRQRMDEMKSSYEQRLAQTEAEARSQIQAQLKEAQDLRQRLMSEASAKYDSMISQAEADIEAERVRVSGELRSEVINLTLQATEKLLGENVDSAKNRALVQNYIDTVGVKP